MSAAICKVRVVRDYERQAGVEYPVPAFHVTCRLCPPTTQTAGDFLESLWGGTPSALLGWSPLLEWAIAFADAHAQLHIDRACQTCNHIPPGEVTREDTQALIQARA